MSETPYPLCSKAFLEKAFSFLPTLNGTLLSYVPRSKTPKFSSATSSNKRLGSSIVSIINPYQLLVKGEGKVLYTNGFNAQEIVTGSFVRFYISARHKLLKRESYWSLQSAGDIRRVL